MPALDQCVTPPSSTLIVSDYNITHPLSMVSFPAYNYILFLILSLQPDDATLLHWLCDLAHEILFGCGNQSSPVHPVHNEEAINSSSLQRRHIRPYHV